jgi:hypothetical protein
VKDKSDLKKCQENNKKKTREINELRKKLLVVTIALAVGGTLIGKESLDKVLEYFQSFDKVKKAIDNVGYVPDSDATIPFPVYYGTSPAPSTLAVFGVFALMPIKRRNN